MYYYDSLSANNNNNSFTKTITSHNDQNNKYLV